MIGHVVINGKPLPVEVRCPVNMPHISYTIRRRSVGESIYSAVHRYEKAMGKRLFELERLIQANLGMYQIVLGGEILFVS